MNHQRQIAFIEREKAINEMNYLRAQVNPHFLFNSLNVVYGHIERENKTARNILLKFSEMLRYQLYECNADSVNIAKEVDYIRNYVSLQKWRKEENLIVQLQLGDALNGFNIAPLLLISFIENAFKYVSNFDEKENKILISLSREGNKLLFHVFNTKDPFQHVHVDERVGIGITNTKRRLEILYPNRHQLDIDEALHCYDVKLSLELL